MGLTAQGSQACPAEAQGQGQGLPYQIQQGRELRLPLLRTMFTVPHHVPSTAVGTRGPSLCQHIAWRQQQAGSLQLQTVSMSLCLLLLGVGGTLQNPRASGHKGSLPPRPASSESNHLTLDGGALKIIWGWTEASVFQESWA